MSATNFFRILVTGSRDWQDVDLITGALDQYTGAENVVLVTGRCPTGADYLAEIYASSLGWIIEPHPADWKLYKAGAGPIRNTEMVFLGADVCLAFIKNASPGATDCAFKAQEAGIQTIIYNEYGKVESQFPNVLHVNKVGPWNTKTQVYVGRGGKWGNPFVIGKDGTRDEVIEKYRAHILSSPLMNDLHELTGKDLVCYCAPQKCHADILVLLANTE